MTLDEAFKKSQQSENEQSQVDLLLKRLKVAEAESFRCSHDLNGLVAALNGSRQVLELHGIPTHPATGVHKEDAVILMNDAWSAAIGKTYMPYDEEVRLKKEIKELKAHISQLEAANLSLLKCSDATLRGQIAILEKERDDALSGHENTMFKVWLKRMQRKHQQPERGRTWFQFPCPHCKTQVLYDCGDTNDLTAPDEEAVRCWSCEKVIDLRDEFGDDHDEEIEDNDLVKRTIPPPGTLREKLGKAADLYMTEDGEPGILGTIWGWRVISQEIRSVIRFIDGPPKQQGGGIGGSIGHIGGLNRIDLKE